MKERMKGRLSVEDDSPLDSRSDLTHSGDDLEEVDGDSPMSNFALNEVDEGEDEESVDIGGEDASETDPMLGMDVSDAHTKRKKPKLSTWELHKKTCGLVKCRNCKQHHKSGETHHCFIQRLDVEALQTP